MASNLKLIWVRVSREDFDKLQRKADKLKLSLNNYLRLEAGLPELKHGGPREYKVDPRLTRARETIAELRAATKGKHKKKKKEMLDAA